MSLSSQSLLSGSWATLHRYVIVLLQIMTNNIKSTNLLNSPWRLGIINKQAWKHPPLSPKKRMKPFQKKISDQKVLPSSLNTSLIPSYWPQEEKYFVLQQWCSQACFHSPGGSCNVWRHFCYHNWWGASGIYWVEAKDAAKCLIYRTAPLTKNYVA